MEKKSKVRKGVRIIRPTLCVRGLPKFRPRFWCEGGSELAVRHFAQGGRQNLDPARDAKGGQSWPSDTLQLGIAKSLPLSKVRMGVCPPRPTLCAGGFEIRKVCPKFEGGSREPVQHSFEGPQLFWTMDPSAKGGPNHPSNTWRRGSTRKRPCGQTAKGGPAGASNVQR